MFDWRAGSPGTGGEAVPFLANLLSDLMRASASDQVALLLAVVGSVIIPSVSLTAWIVRRWRRSEISALRSDNEALQSSNEAKQKLIATLRTINSDRQATIDALRERSVEWIAEAIAVRDATAPASALSFFREDGRHLAAVAAAVAISLLENDSLDESCREKALTLAQLGRISAPEDRDCAALIMDLSPGPVPNGGVDEIHAPDAISPGEVVAAETCPVDSQALIFQLLQRGDAHLKKHRSHIAERLYRQANIVLQHGAPMSLQWSQLAAVAIPARQAQARMNQGMRERALRCLNDALASAKGSELREVQEIAFDCLWKRASILCSAGRLEEACTDYAMLTGNIDEPRTSLLALTMLWERAICEYKAGKHEQAVAVVHAQMDHFIVEHGPDSTEADYRRVTLARMLARRNDFHHAWELLEPMLARRDSYKESGHQLSDQIDGVIDDLAPGEGPWANLSFTDFQPNSEFPLSLPAYAPILEQAMQRRDSEGRKASDCERLRESN